MSFLSKDRKEGGSKHAGKSAISTGARSAKALRQEHVDCVPGIAWR